MNNKTQFLVILLLAPSLAEAVSSKFLIPISGFPLSLGRITFILSGLIGLSIFGFGSYRTNILKGLIIIAVGCFIGAFFSDDLLDNISASLGFFALVIGSSGVAMLFYFSKVRSVIDIYFIVLFFYWIIYVISLTFIGGSFRSFSSLYKEENLINHHIIGIALSLSSIYLSGRFFFKNERLNGLGYVLLGTALISELLIESRSNFIFLLITVIILLLFERRNLKEILFRTVPVILIGVLLFWYFTSTIEQVKRRFTLYDIEYQKRTSEMRITYLKIAFNVIKDKPLGSGLNNVKLDVSGARRLTHNQYVTFILGGGLMVIFGIILMLKEIFFSFIKIFKTKVINLDYGEYSFFYGAIIVCLLYYITLLSIESLGLIFYLIVAMSIFVAYNLKLNKYEV